MPINSYCLSSDDCGNGCVADSVAAGQAYLSSYSLSAISETAEREQYSLIIDIDIPSLLQQPYIILHTAVQAVGYIQYITHTGRGPSCVYEVSFSASRTPAISPQRQL